jgi:hypothetical protein
VPRDRRKVQLLVAYFTIDFSIWAGKRIRPDSQGGTGGLPGLRLARQHPGNYGTSSNAP